MTLKIDSFAAFVSREYGEETAEAFRHASVGVRSFSYSTAFSILNTCLRAGRSSNVPKFGPMNSSAPAVRFHGRRPARKP